MDFLWSTRKKRSVKDGSKDLSPEQMKGWYVIYRDKEEGQGKIGGKEQEFS